MKPWEKWQVWPVTCDLRPAGDSIVPRQQSIGIMIIYKDILTGKILCDHLECYLFGIMAVETVFMPRIYFVRIVCFKSNMVSVMYWSLVVVYLHLLLKYLLMISLRKSDHRTIRGRKRSRTSLRALEGKRSVFFDIWWLQHNHKKQNCQWIFSCFTYSERVSVSEYSRVLLYSELVSYGNL